MVFGECIQNIKVLYYGYFDSGAAGAASAVCAAGAAGAAGVAPVMPVLLAAPAAPAAPEALAASPESMGEKGSRDNAYWMRKEGWRSRRDCLQPLQIAIVNLVSECMKMVCTQLVWYNNQDYIW